MPRSTSPHRQSKPTRNSGLIIAWLCGLLVLVNASSFLWDPQSQDSLLARAYVFCVGSVIGGAICAWAGYRLGKRAKRTNPVQANAPFNPYSHN